MNNHEKLYKERSTENKPKKKKMQDPLDNNKL